ncbi:MAG: glycosyltransferase [Bacteroidota bacterium]
MELQDFNKTYKNHRILVAPLDWGLGHATRCIPIIKALIDNNCDVIIAAKGATANLLQPEFPEIEIIELNGYAVQYSSSKALLPFKIIGQVPKILSVIYKEHKWLKEIVKIYNIDAVISDNRFGLFCKSVPCIFITHQLLIKTGNNISERIAQKINYQFIKKYAACWVPDFESKGIAGELSHPATLLQNIKYIGALSRFEKNNEEKKYDLLVLLSGPEPQRTIFENILLDQLKSFSGVVLFVRGMPQANDKKKSSNIGVKIVDHLSAKELNKSIQQSKMVISRSGYTTVMDLIKLGQKAILVATPGQTEQEYLAKHLMQQKLFYCTTQEKFELSQILERIKDFNFSVIERDMEQYKKVITQFVQSLKKD